jgi:hypothetical protein
LNSQCAKTGENERLPQTAQAQNLQNAAELIQKGHSGRITQDA